MGYVSLGHELTSKLLKMAAQAMERLRDTHAPPVRARANQTFVCLWETDNLNRIGHSSLSFLVVTEEKQSRLQKKKKINIGVSQPSRRKGGRGRALRSPLPPCPLRQGQQGACVDS